MLDDYKYSVGRLVVYEHPDPKLPRQSYGQHGPRKTIGEVVSVDMIPEPGPHWLYTVRNFRNQETTRVEEDKVKFATSASRYWRRGAQRTPEPRMAEASLVEMIAKALSEPARESLLRSALRDMLQKEQSTLRAAQEGVNLPLGVGDYIRVRGDLRKDCEPIHNHYARILVSEPADIAGIENANPKPGQPMIYRTNRKYSVLTSEKVTAEIYDAEVKVFYTCDSGKTVLNWRAATLLAESFGDAPPYNLEFEYLLDHIFTRDELAEIKRKELVQMLGRLMYVKGKLGYREFLRRDQILSGMPKSHLVDAVLEMSRFDSKRNRQLTTDEIAHRRKQYFRLRRMLKT
jgi:hypothetical protein